MQGKTVVITGATSGIGEVAAVRLAEKGARIIAIARSKARGEATLAALRRASASDHQIHYADLSTLAEMKRLGAELAQAYPRIDVLINNAGAMFTTRQVTADGLEMTFAVNHMAYFVLTNLLLGSLKAAGAARIVSTASDAHRAGKIHFADLQLARSYGGKGWTAYCQSKLMNVLFTRELARRLQGSAVTANCLHPGFVASRFGDNNSGGLMSMAFGLAKRFAITPEKGAETIIYLGSAAEVAGSSGGYYEKCRPAKPSAAAQNDADATRLWDMTAQIAGLGA